MKVSETLTDKIHTLICQIISIDNYNKPISLTLRNELRQWLVDVADEELAHKQTTKKEMMDNYLKDESIDIWSQKEIADRLLQLADGSNYGTLEELQEQILGWHSDLINGFWKPELLSKKSVSEDDESNAIDCPTCGQGHIGIAANNLRNKLNETN